jgi:acetyltransferase-like isoleucine patch superfamily enzyme
VKVALLRLAGHKIGKGTKIGIFSLVIVDSLSTGANASIGSFSYINCTSLTLGNRTSIKSLVAIETNAVTISHDSIVMQQNVIGGMRTPRSRLYIGERVKVFPYSFINPTEPVVIEDDVGIGGANYIFTHGSWQSALDGFPISFGAVTIRKGVWLPWRVFIMPGIEIGEYSTIGANSLINKNIPPYSLAAGSPAKLLSTDGKHLKPKTDQEKAAFIKTIYQEMLEYFVFEGSLIEGITLTSLPVGAESCAHKITRNGKSETIILDLSLGKFYPSQQRNTPVTQISLFGIPENVKEQLNRDNIAWLDLNSNSCNIVNNECFSPIRNYLSRYGIRFRAINEEVITDTH